ncbi:MAG: hypothetical protein OEU92_27095, partial [Alphaproteobacteria bacterium]|nr:hypothetical protein [Alphaproteobacteria bacterium]
RHFEAVAKTYGVWPRAALIYKRGEASHGMAYREALRVAESADLLITRSGRIDKLAELFERPAKRVFIDGNPGATQVGFACGDEAFRMLDRYQHLFTMGLNIGRADNRLPTGGRQWHPIHRPIVLSHWPTQPAAGGGRFTTISTWRGRATFDWRGQASGEKADNWLAFLDLPARTNQTFEIALRMSGADAPDDRQMFQRHGWRLADPKTLSTLDDYRRYISRSRAEFSVAHNRYVAFETGWFSDRSAVYLASGRPVLVQSTGIEEHLPTGAGLLTFKTIDEAIAGVESLNGDYSAHCQVARDIAEGYFDSDRVLSRMLERVT